MISFSRRLHVFDVKLPELDTIPLCMEQWSHPLGGRYYSAASMIFIYIIPITTVSLAYKKICVKLRNRLGTKIMNKTSSTRKAQMEDQKISRTNKLLASMALAFCISWLPLNVVNILDDFDVIKYPNRATKFTIFALCHMTGMISACINPILYGYLNENFRKEFHEMYVSCRGSSMPRRDKSMDSKRSTWMRETTNNMEKDGNEESWNSTQSVMSRRVAFSVAKYVLCRNTMRVSEIIFFLLQQQMEDQKISRTNKLLASMALAFCISWLPLNVVNILDDFDVIKYPNRATKFTIFALCHMTGMISACINPILYGYLNENFRKEFHEMYVSCRGSSMPRRDKSMDSKRSTWMRETTNNMEKDGNEESW
ncbi:unnamed protein product [Notodromas monacha]|uniref:G-protein coupled receptors family 1 profile domain-containing protein n=1 Tax=Notodromas monacha TaxID=399045 RepID=A0A7R9BM52_9CRUS|nr:unnamed protein product [Notodromas monacha]CAG0917196.1 unnamed protein product [Notodromas monacha]